MSWSRRCWIEDTTGQRKTCFVRTVLPTSSTTLYVLGSVMGPIDMSSCKRGSLAGSQHPAHCEALARARSRKDPFGPRPYAHMRSWSVTPNLVPSEYSSSSQIRVVRQLGHCTSSPRAGVRSACQILPQFSQPTNLPLHSWHSSQNHPLLAPSAAEARALAPAAKILPVRTAAMNPPKSSGGCKVPPSPVGHGASMKGRVMLLSEAIRKSGPLRESQ